MRKSNSEIKDKTNLGSKATQNMNPDMSNTQDFGDALLDRGAERSIDQAEQHSPEELEDLEQIGVTRETVARGLAQDNMASEDLLIEENRPFEESEMMEEGRQMVSSLAEEIKNIAIEQVERGKHWTSGELNQIARALDHAADELTNNQNDLGRFARKASNQLDRFSQNLDNQNLSSLVDKVEQFTRRQPELIFCGSLLGGLLLSRFLRSSQWRYHS